MLIESPDAYKYLSERMETAEELFAKDETAEAKKIWNYTANEFKGVQSHLFTWFYHLRPKSIQRNSISDSHKGTD